MEARTCVQKEAIAGMHAAIILGGMYVDRAQKTAPEHSKKKKSEKSKSS